mgnify:CR=1 FL=1
MQSIKSNIEYDLVVAGIELIFDVLGVKRTIVRYIML